MLNMPIYSYIPVTGMSWECASWTNYGVGSTMNTGGVDKIDVDYDRTAV